VRDEGGRAVEILRAGQVCFLPREGASVYREYGRAWEGVLPLGRVTLGAGGAAGGVTYAAVEQAVASSTPGCTALAWAGGKGLVFPAAMILLHQPAYLLAIVNAEPLERHNGRFGLRIIARGADA